MFCAGHNNNKEGDTKMADDSIGIISPVCARVPISELRDRERHRERHREEQDRIKALAETRPSALIGQGWCQGCYARDGDGKQCAIDSPQAAAWSLYGAISRARMAGHQFPTTMVKASLADNAMNNNRWNMLENWNDMDTTRRGDVLHLLERHGL